MEILMRKGTKQMSNQRWNSDRIQFPRLLAELRAISLTEQQYAELTETMDLTRDQIDELLERAEEAWGAQKQIGLIKGEGHHDK